MMSVTSPYAFLVSVTKHITADFGGLIGNKNFCNMKLCRSIVSAAALLALVACNSKQVEYLSFQESEDGYWGLIDRKGNVLFADEFENGIDCVSDGILITKNDENERQLYALGKKPKLICEGFERIGVFNDGVAPAVMKNEWIKFIDKKGNVVSELKEIDGLHVEWIKGFLFGVAVYGLEDGRQGLIDTRGRVLTKPASVEINFCSDDIGAEVDNEMLLVNYTNGALLLHYKDYIDGRTEKAYFQLDEEKHSLSFFQNSEFYCVSSEKKHNIMQKGKEVAEFKRDSKTSYIVDVRGSYLLFSDARGYKKGVMDLKGNTVIRPRYEFLAFMDEKTLLCSTDSENFEIIDIKENVINDCVDICEGVSEDDFDFQLYDGVACFVNNEEEFYFVNRKGKPIGKKTYYEMEDCLPYVAYIASDFFNVNKFIQALEISEVGVAGIGLNSTYGEFVELDMKDWGYTPSNEEDILYHYYYNSNDMEFEQYEIGLRHTVKIQYSASFTEPLVTIQKGGIDWNNNSDMSRLIVGIMLDKPGCDYEDKGQVIFDGLYELFKKKCVASQENSDTDISFSFSGVSEVRLINNTEMNAIVLCYFP